MCNSAPFFAAPGNGAGAFVVVNGCRDQTAARARSFAAMAAQNGWHLLGLDRPTGAKPGALNAGDAAVRHPIRACLDADVLVSPPLTAALATALSAPEPRYATGTDVIPPPRTAISCAHARFWQQLDFARSDAPGYGPFATNAAGRARWADFADLISDDTVTRLQFDPAARLHLPQTCQWPMIEGFAALSRVRARQDVSILQLDRLYPDLLPREFNPPLTRLLRLALTGPTGFAAAALRSRFQTKSNAFRRGSQGLEKLGCRGSKYAKDGPRLSLIACQLPG